MNAQLKDTRVDANATLAIEPVWKQVTPALADELVELWRRNHALVNPAQARARAEQAVCVARDATGALCGVGTAIARVLPRLRQPLYYYRQYFAPEIRGQGQAIAFYNKARQVLEAYNAALAAPESLGVLVELENRMLARHYTRAYEPVADSTFIGYSPKGLQLRVSYFPEARLLPAAPIGRRRGGALASLAVAGQAPGR
jgi:hypothetical protein